MSNPILILKHQAEFLQSTARHTGLVAGFGAGKSRAATIKVVEFKKRYPGIDAAYYLPTYGLIRKIAFNNFESTLKEHNIPYDLNRSEFVFYTTLGEIYLQSMNNPENIVGYEVGYSVIDEADRVPHRKMKDAMVNIVARNRTPLPGELDNCLDLVSTPEGFAFMYEFFVKNSKPSRHLIRANSRDNPYLPPSYFEALMDIYTEQQIEAYIDGQFVNLTTGLVFHAYDREINASSREVKPSDKLHLGMDFNITNMSAVFHTVDGQEIHAVDEITKAYDTADIITIIKDRYPSNRIVIYPDASGNNRNTAGPSDIKLLKRAGFMIKVGRSNPRVRDRVTTANAAFKNAKGVSSYFVNAESCPDYAEALEKQPYKKGVPDKESGFDHINEAGTYPIYMIKKGKGRARITAG